MSPQKLIPLEMSQASKVQVKTKPLDVVLKDWEMVVTLMMDVMVGYIYNQMEMESKSQQVDVNKLWGMMMMHVG